MKNEADTRIKIVGITGQPLAGKDTAAGFFVSKGFTHFSCGDILREEMVKVGIPVDRAHMGPFASEAKKKRGMGYLAELAANRVTGDTVISGLRAGLEVEILRKRFTENFILLAIDAPIKTRYNRAQKRRREGDTVSFEKFRQIEERERADPSGAQEVDKVIAMADQTIDNSSTLADLDTKLDRFLGALSVVR